MKVYIPQMVAKEAVEELEALGYEVDFGNGETEEDLIRDVADADAILLRTAPCTKAVLEAGKKLKIVARHGAGYNNVDLKAADELGIWVTNTPDATTNSVAEFTLGAIITIARSSFELAKEGEQGNFYYKYTHKGVDLKGKTLAIIGYGRIGASVAAKAYYGLGMNIIAYDPSNKPAPEYVKLVDWDTAFKEADFVSLHMPLLESTRNCVSTKEFDLMKETARFINCARGEVVDQKALTKALQDGKIAAAFLDVLETEPFDINDPLFSMKNVVITPHIASNTWECMKDMACQAASQIHKVLSGNQPDWPVNHPKQ